MRRVQSVVCEDLGISVYAQSDVCCFVLASHCFYGFTSARLEWGSENTIVI